MEKHLKGSKDAKKAKVKRQGKGEKGVQQK